MTLTEVNEVLKNLSQWNLEKSYTKVATATNNEWNKEGSGYEGTRETIYDLKNGIFLKIIETQDSYGNDEQITGIQFVKPKEVLVTQFEAI